ncbi:hypothetical protein BHC57_08345 [Snodgrassella alvi]|uniref:Transposase n=1 Tax=Snodgrassella alvi TaxID=1196083 RepID=A0A855G649_9NEIS|nr:hypothetical protein BHC57_08345 [Snodgrassella alvi]
MNQSAKIIKLKLGLLELAKQLGNVQQACKVLGYSRDSYYHSKKLLGTGRRINSLGNKSQKTYREKSRRTSY